MPRKTRKQKERAQRHPSGVVKGEFTFSFKEEKQTLHEPQQGKRNENSVLLSDMKLTVRDLVKSIVFALAIFSLEIVIYLAWFK